MQVRFKRSTHYTFYFSANTHSTLQGLRTEKNSRSFYTRAPTPFLPFYERFFAYCDEVGLNNIISKRECVLCFWWKVEEEEEEEEEERKIFKIEFWN